MTRKETKRKCRADCQQNRAIVAASDHGQRKAASVDADGLKTALLVDYGIKRKQARNHTD